MEQSQYFEKALGFIHSIGIETSFEHLEEEECFLPGLLICNGRILVDRENLAYPGDILHEAAHLALVPAAERDLVAAGEIGKRADAAAEEMAAIAWTYAACRHLDIDPAFVFHEHGYRGDAVSIAESFEQGRGFGVPILQWLGMTGKDGYEFPAMAQWKRD